MHKPNEENQAMQDRIAELQSEVGQLTEKLAISQQTLEATKLELQRVSTERAAVPSPQPLPATVETEALKSQVQNLQAQLLAAGNQRSADLQSLQEMHRTEKESLTAQVSSLQAAAQAAQQSLDDLSKDQESTDQLKKELDTLKQTLAEKDSDVGRLKRELEKSNTERQSNLQYARDMFARQKEEIATLKKEATAQTKSYEALHKDASNVEQLARKLHEEKTIAVESNKELKTQIKELEKSATLAERSIANLEKQVVRLEIAMEEQDEVEADLKQTIKDGKAEVAQRDKDIRSIERELASSQKQMEKLAASHGKQIDRLTKQQSVADAKIKDGAKFKKQATDLGAALKKREKSLKQTEKDLAAVRKDKAKAEADLKKRDKEVAALVKQVALLKKSAGKPVNKSTATKKVVKKKVTKKKVAKKSPKKKSPAKKTTKKKVVKKASKKKVAKKKVTKKTAKKKRRR